MEKKTTVWIPINLHNKLKHRATDERSTIEKELIKILKKELNEQNKESKELKREKINANI